MQNIYTLKTNLIFTVTENIHGITEAYTEYINFIIYNLNGIYIIQYFYYILFYWYIFILILYLKVRIVLSCW